MDIIDFIRRSLACPDFETFIQVVQGDSLPSRVHFAELLVDPEVIAYLTEHVLGEKSVALETGTLPEYLGQCVRWWHRMGYDYVMMIDIPGVGLEFPSRSRVGEDSGPLARGERTWVEEGQGMITSWEDFEKYPWPEVSDIDLFPYEYVSSILPEVKYPLQIMCQ